MGICGISCTKAACPLCFNFPHQDLLGGLPPSLLLVARAASALRREHPGETPAASVHDMLLLTDLCKLLVAPGQRHSNPRPAREPEVACSRQISWGRCGLNAREGVRGRRVFNSRRLAWPESNKKKAARTTTIETPRDRKDPPLHVPIWIPANICQCTNVRSSLKVVLIDRHILGWWVAALINRKGGCWAGAPRCTYPQKAQIEAISQHRVKRRVRCLSLERDGFKRRRSSIVSTYTYRYRACYQVRECGEILEPNL